MGQPLNGRQQRRSLLQLPSGSSAVHRAAAALAAAALTVALPIPRLHGWAGSNDAEVLPGKA